MFDGIPQRFWKLLPTFKLDLYQRYVEKRTVAGDRVAYRRGFLKEFPSDKRTREPTGDNNDTKRARTAVTFAQWFEKHGRE